MSLGAAVELCVAVNLYYLAFISNLIFFDDTRNSIDIPMNFPTTSACKIRPKKISRAF